MEGGEEAGAEIMVDSKDLQQQSKALDKLTDRVEDRQLDSNRVQSVCCSFVHVHRNDEYYPLISLQILSSVSKNLIGLTRLMYVLQAMASIGASREADLNAKRLR